LLSFLCFSYLISKDLRSSKGRRRRVQIFKNSDFLCDCAHGQQLTREMVHSKVKCFIEAEQHFIEHEDSSLV
jgi:hypothetical protein